MMTRSKFTVKSKLDNQISTPIININNGSTLSSSQKTTEARNIASQLEKDEYQNSGQFGEAPDEEYQENPMVEDTKADGEPAEVIMAGPVNNANHLMPWEHPIRAPLKQQVHDPAHDLFAGAQHHPLPL